MIPRAEEMQRAMAGCFAVLRRDPDAMDHFGDDAGAFIRSFFAFALVFPLALVQALAAGGSADDGHGVSLLTFFLLHLTGWLLWPAAADLLARGFGRSDRQYFRYIVAYNWAQLPVAGIAMLAALVAPPLFPVVLILALVYLVLLAQTALEVPLPSAIALVIADIGLSFLLRYLVLGLSVAGGAATPA